MHEGIHIDYQYEAIGATVNPETIRTHQRILASQYVVNGFDMRPSENTIEIGKKLIECWAQITVEAMRRATENRKCVLLIR